MPKVAGSTDIERHRHRSACRFVLQPRISARSTPRCFWKDHLMLDQKSGLADVAGLLAPDHVTTRSEALAKPSPIPGEAGSKPV